MEALLFTIILAPLAASALTYLFRVTHGWITIGASIVSLLASVFLLISTKPAFSFHYHFAGFVNQSFHLYANAGSLVLATVVSVTALCIFIYAVPYMQHENGKTWFWGGISLFLSAMFLLVFAGDWILLITAWEIMGAASFLLIATWHEKAEARQGAVKAFMLTRFTDLFLYAGVFVMIFTFRNSNIAQETKQQLSATGGIFLLIAVMGKSAQVPFQSWLSGAMAGPTPASALLHSATMVGAGAILLFRVYPLLNENVLFITGAIGGIAILLAGITAIASHDVKQLLAASTSSQLGFMLLAIGAGSPGAAFGHWIAHAFMKSSLFLSAGIFQHVYKSTSFSDIYGAGKKLKTTFIAFAIAAVSSSGIPPLIGYWSKDGILAAAGLSHYHALFFLLAVAGAFLTAVYMGKAISRLWHGDNKTAIQPAPKQMIAGLFGLLALIVAGGFFLKPMVSFAGYALPSDNTSTIAGILVAVAGLASGWLLPESWFAGRVWNTIRDNYSFAGGYQKLIAEPVLQLARFVYKIDLLLLSLIQQAGYFFLRIARFARTADSSLNEWMIAMGKAGLQVSSVSKTIDESVEAGVYGISKSVKESGQLSRKLQTGLVHQELVITVAGMLVLIFIFIAMISY